MKTRPHQAPWQQRGAGYILLNLGIILVYVVSGKLGLLFASVNPSATTIWAPTGIALASLLIFGYRVVPAIFLGAFFANSITAGTVLTSLAIAAGNTLEAFIGAYLVKTYANGIHAFEKVLDIFKFTFFAAILSTTVSADIGVTTLVMGKLASWHTFLPIWTTWWLGDMGGNLIVAPFLLVWATHPRIRFHYKKALHLLIVATSLIIVTEIIFLGILPYPYLSIPIGVWIAFWFGRRGATVITILVAIIATYLTLHGQGPFAREASLNQSLLLLEMFLGTFSVTVLTFAATVLEISKGEKVIASHEQRFKALIEKSFDSVVLIDPSSKILYASPSVKQLLGYRPEELEGTIGFDLVFPEDRPKTMRKLAELVLKPGGSVTLEYRTQRKDKKLIWVEATGTNLLLEPNISAVVVNFHDITDKKNAEEKILREKMEDEAMLSSIGDGIIATDSTGKITMVNQVASEALGWKKNELVGKLLAKAVPMIDENDHTLTITDRPLTKVLSLGKEIITSPKNYYIRKDKTKLPVRFTVTPIILEGKIAGTIEVFRDITKEKEVDRAKSEFVSIASHQLRTPLTIINWYVERLKEHGNTADKKQSTYLEAIYHASARMVELINALLNVSRLELGTFIVELQQVRTEDIANQVLQDFQPAIENKKLIVEKHFPSSMRPLSADPKLLTIIFQNLLSNAVKSSANGGKIVLQIASDTKGFSLRVTDNGYGIPKSQQSKIFTKMFRADNARNADPDGTGLGLYIVKSIIDVTGGEIRFESQENKGTTFFVSFPPSGMREKRGQKPLS